MHAADDGVFAVEQGQRPDRFIRIFAAVEFVINDIEADTGLSCGFFGQGERLSGIEFDSFERKKPLGETVGVIVITQAFLGDPLVADPEFSKEVIASWDDSGDAPFERLRVAGGAGHFDNFANGGTTEFFFELTQAELSWQRFGGAGGGSDGQREAEDE